MKTSTTIGLMSILVVGILLMLLYGCGGGSTEPASGAELAGLNDLAGSEASGTAGDGSGITDKPSDAAGTAGDGDWQRRGHRGRRAHPVYGEIAAIDGDVITITPMIPEIIAQKIEEHMAERDVDSDKAWPHELPAEITLLMTDETKFIIGDGELDSNPFVVGDTVVVKAGRSEEVDMKIVRSISEGAGYIAMLTEKMSGDG